MKEETGDHGHTNECSSSKCFELVDPKFRFCQKCGTEQSKVKCLNPKCHEMLHRQYEFCTKCGYS